MIEAMAQGTPVAAFPVQGPIDVVENGINGWMDENLITAVEHCLLLDRKKVAQASQRWTWKACWQIFERNLINHKKRA
jgi:glycosyltransferase involved in cell wall biosynthesis